MAAIPKGAAPRRQPTLEAVDEHVARIGNLERSRHYLGASAIGGECERALWYSFHWVDREVFGAETIKRFEDGHRGEDIMAARLRLVPDIQLHAVDPRSGQQFEVVACNGHFRGHLDGAILGVYEAPKTWHVWEHKSCGEKVQAELVKCITEHGEKGALKAWKPVYYAQAQVYMKLTGMHRHFLTVSTPGERSTISVRTDYCGADAKEYLDRAGRIIAATEPPARISEKPEFYLCKHLCGFREVCHERKVPAVNCRTCAHSTPVMDGEHGAWSCARADAGVSIPVDVQRTGCPSHIYNPKVMPWKAVDADQAANWIEYQKEGDSSVRFRNGGSGVGHFTSEELRSIDPSLLGDPVMDAIKNSSGAPWLAPSQINQEKIVPFPAHPVWSAAETADTTSTAPHPPAPAWARAGSHPASAEKAPATA